VTTLAAPASATAAADALAAQGIDTPSLVVDLDILEANVRSMQAVCDRAGLALRPHAKTHKSARIARLQLETGAVGISSSKVSEATALRAAGIRELFLVYPVVGEAKLAALGELVADGGVMLAADSIEVAEGYSRMATRVGRSVPVLLEIDSGMARVGCVPAEAGRLGAAMARLPGVELRGLTTHAGHTHDVATQPEIEAIARDEVRALARAREALEGAGVEVAIVSAGSSITTPYLRASDGITEARPGTYVMNDYRTLELFACTPETFAGSMLAAVVSRGPGRAVIDAGNKTLTPTRTEQHGYGRLRGRPRSTFTRLSEEHGVLALAPEDEDLRVGDHVEVLPIHICAWMDLQREVYGVRGGRLVETIAVDAMRRSR
jgi:D-serine deaminase-like pyridoxal phosphate-dependent protein